MKQRLDVLLAQRSLAPSREAARRLVMAGTVYVDGQKCDKAGTPVRDSAHIEVRAEAARYVSRGGYKLEKALAEFPIRLEGRVCMDVGASTGGFTDCMLQNGAVKVFAVDVGYGQLAWKLRADPRVVCLERTNIRYLEEGRVGEPIGFASVDVSFISLALVLPTVRRLLAPGGEAVALIKPQFEAGRGSVGKKGVVRDKGVHAEVVGRVAAFAAEQGFSVAGLTFSPIKGPQGNIEYLIWLRGEALAGGIPPGPAEIEALVERSHGQLDERRQE